MSSVNWQWDFASQQYVRWIGRPHNCYVNQTGHQVDDPQLTMPPPPPPSITTDTRSPVTNVPTSRTAAPNVSNPRMSSTTSSSRQVAPGITIPANTRGSTVAQQGTRQTVQATSITRGQQPVQPNTNTFLRAGGNLPSYASGSQRSLETQMGEMSINQPRSTNPSSGTGVPVAQTAKDPYTGAQTRWERGQTTGGTGSSQMAYNPMRIRELEGQRNQHVLKGYSRQPQTDYRPGRVVEVLLVPPESTGSTASGTTPKDEDMETPARTIARLRRFVIVRENVDNRNAFEAIAIKTYNSQGVAATGVIKSHHTIIYTGKPPKPTDEEKPQRLPSGQTESGMLSTALRVVPYDRGKALDPMARLDYGDRYQFDQGVPNIRLFGRVHDKHLAALFLQYNQVWNSIQRLAQGAVAPSSALPTEASSQTVVPTVRRDFTNANSGPIADDQVRELLRRYTAYANRHGYPMPEQQPNSNGIRTMAQNSATRAAYFQRIRSLWQNSADDSGPDDDDDDE